MIVKCGRKEIALDKNDVIMHNGACYQIITKKYRQGFDKRTPIIAKAKAKQMIQDGDLVFDRAEKSKYIKSELEYYKIRV